MTMKYHTDDNHPNPDDSAAGTTVFWADEPDTIICVVWTGYGAGDGEFNATRAKFAVDEENKTLTLKRVSIKRKYSPWDDFLTTPQAFISDRMKRVLRDFIANERGSQYWRVQLYE